MEANHWDDAHLYPDDKCFITSYAELPNKGIFEKVGMKKEPSSYTIRLLVIASLEVEKSR